MAPAVRRHHKWTINDVVMQLFDTHCHLDAPEFAADLEAVLVRARSAGIGAMVVPGVTRQGWPRLLHICAREADCYPALGLHPLFLKEHGTGALEELADTVAGCGVAAVGEIGLDFYLPQSDRAGQQHLFEAQVRIARAARLPVLLHVRKAHDQVLSTLRRLRFDSGGIVHAFSGSLQQAERYVELHFRIGIGGTLTYDRAARVRRVAQALPATALVLETDAPDLPPAGHRGQRNSPEFLPEILDALAAVREESRQTLAAQTTLNAREVLALR